MSVDWSQGFRIESDGTVAGTRFYNSDNQELIGFTDIMICRPREREGTAPIQVLTMGEPEVKPGE